MIPYGRQSISDADIAAVVAVLRSDWLTQGPVVPKFEAALKDICGAHHAVAVNSATAALHLACRALDLGPGDRLWTSDITFLASANSGKYCGADVDFVDIDDRTYNMSVAALAAKLEDAARRGTLPKIVMPVHLAGQSCEMQEIADLARRYGFRVIEDASHAIGGAYGDSPVGSCRYSDICVFSFHPVKIVTTGEGGAALCNDEALAERMRLLRSHGMTRDRGRWLHDGGPWYYEQHELGYNYRMPDVLAALGISQLARIDEFVARRRAIAARYDTELRHERLVLPWQHPHARSSYHLYPIRVVARDGCPDRRSVFDGLRAADVGVNVHYIPLHTQPFYAPTQGGASFAASDRYYSEAISLPIFAALTDEEQSVVIREVLKQLR
jgi:UDP-4-amino-4,6-dideoxy-N-acetyl-beta-L-altrosamine transaminase